MAACGHRMIVIRSTRHRRRGSTFHVRFQQGSLVGSRFLFPVNPGSRRPAPLCPVREGKAERGYLSRQIEECDARISAAQPTALRSITRSLVGRQQFRRKGELTRKAIDRDRPHQVALPTPIPHHRDMQDFCRAAGLSLCQRTTGFYRDVGREVIWYACFCFADRGHSENFQARFKGEFIDLTIGRDGLADNRAAPSKLFGGAASWLNPSVHIRAARESLLPSTSELG